jgi:hypothetical protein
MEELSRIFHLGNRPFRIDRLKSANESVDQIVVTSNSEVLFEASVKEAAFFASQLRAMTANSSDEKMRATQRASKPWTDAEEEQVLKMWNDGMEPERIGELIERSGFAVLTRLKKLNPRLVAVVDKFR